MDLCFRGEGSRDLPGRDMSLFPQTVVVRSVGGGSETGEDGDAEERHDEFRASF